ncbi:hypothetical protein E4U42_004717, partial [Claviceps africana]
MEAVVVMPSSFTAHVLGVEEASLCSVPPNTLFGESRSSQAVFLGPGFHLADAGFGGSGGDVVPSDKEADAGLTFRTFRA